MTGDEDRDRNLLVMGLVRLFRLMAGVPADRFDGCGFPSCACVGRCVVFDATVLVG